MSLAPYSKKPQDEIWSKSGKHEDQLSIGMVRNDGLKAVVAVLTCEVMKLEEFLHTFRSQERKASAKVKTLNAQQSSVLDHLRILLSKMPGF